MIKWKYKNKKHKDQDMKTAAKVAYNTIYQVIGKAVAMGLTLASVAIITRQLGQADFGEYTIIMTFLAFFGILADFGLTLVTAQMISQPEADEEKILNNLFTWRLTSALFLLSLAPVVGWFFPYSQAIKIGIFLGSAAFLFNALSQVLVGFFQKHLRMDYVAIAEAGGRLALLISVVIVYFKNWGLLGFVGAAVVGNLVNFLFLFFRARNFSPIRLAFDFSLWRTIWQKSWPLTITIILNLLYLKTDILLLSVWKEAADVGLYGAAYKVVDVVITLPFMFCGLILPLLTKAWAQKDNNSFKVLAQKSFDFMLLVALPLVIGAQFTARSLMVLLAGQEFSQAGQILQVLILAAAMIFIGSVAAHAIVAIDKQKKMIGAYLFTALSAILGYVLFIPRFSYWGAAWVTVYSETIIALFSWFFVYKYTGFVPRLAKAGKGLLSALLMGVGLWFVKSWSLFILLFLGVVSYTFFLYLLGGIKKSDLFELFKND